MDDFIKFIHSFNFVNLLAQATTLGRLLAKFSLKIFMLCFMAIPPRAGTLSENQMKAVGPNPYDAAAPT